MFPLLLLLL